MEVNPTLDTYHNTEIITYRFWRHFSIIIIFRFDKQFKYLPSPQFNTLQHYKHNDG